MSTDYRSTCVSGYPETVHSLIDAWISPFWPTQTSNVYYSTDTKIAAARAWKCPGCGRWQAPNTARCDCEKHVDMVDYDLGIYASTGFPCTEHN